MFHVRVGMSYIYHRHTYSHWTPRMPRHGNHCNISSNRLVLAVQRIFLNSFLGWRLSSFSLVLCKDTIPKTFFCKYLLIMEMLQVVYNAFHVPCLGGSHLHARFHTNLPATQGMIRQFFIYSNDNGNFIQLLLHCNHKCELWPLHRTCQHTHKHTPVNILCKHLVQPLMLEFKMQRHFKGHRRTKTKAWAISEKCWDRCPAPSFDQWFHNQIGLEPCWCWP